MINDINYKKNSDNDCAKDGKSDLGVVRVVVVVSTYKYFFGKFLWQSTNTIRDGGSITLYTVYNIETALRYFSNSMHAYIKGKVERYWNGLMSF